SAPSPASSRRTSTAGTIIATSIPATTATGTVIIIITTVTIAEDLVAKAGAAPQRRPSFGAAVNDLLEVLDILVGHERFTRSAISGGCRRPNRRSRHVADGQALARRPRQDGEEARRGGGRGRDRRHDRPDRGGGPGKRRPPVQSHGAL